MYLCEVAVVCYKFILKFKIKFHLNLFDFSTSEITQMCTVLKLHNASVTESCRMDVVFDTTPPTMLPTLETVFVKEILSSLPVSERSMGRALDSTTTH